MEKIIFYLLQVAVCSSIFTLVYYFLLRKTTHHQFNRLFLLSSLPLAFLLPLYKFSYKVWDLPSTFPRMSDGVKAVSPTPAPQTDLWLILGVLFVIGLFIMLIKNILIFYKLAQIRENGVCAKQEKYTEVDSETVHTPFSFLSTIYINSKAVSALEKDIIVKHELIHIQQKHGLDLLCLQGALLLQWFNPLMWLYSSCLKENHEYLVDEAMQHQGVSLASYKASLINQKFQGPVFSFANSFNYSNLLNRFAMMKKEKTSPWRKLAVLAVLPLFSIFYVTTAQAHYMTLGSIPFDIAGDSVVVTAYKATPDGVSFTDAKDMICILDGKLVSMDVLKTLDPKEIATVSIQKGESIDPQYKKNGIKGVIYVTTKKAGDTLTVSTQEVSTIRLDSGGDSSKILFYLDGKLITKSDLDKLDTKTIESVNVYKGKDAIEKYGEKAVNGVVLITSKPK